MIVAAGRHHELLPHHSPAASTPRRAATFASATGYTRSRGVVGAPGQLRGHARRLLPHEGGDVFDAGDPLPRTAAACRPEPQLNRPTPQRHAGRAVVGVPLEAHVAGCQGPPPIVGGRIRFGSERGVDGPCEDGVESVAAEADRQHGLLALLARPAGPVHHPEEVRLDPKLIRSKLNPPPPKWPCVGGGGADLAPVRLVDDERFRASNCARMCRPAFGQHRFLRRVRFQ